MPSQGEVIHVIALKQLFKTKSTMNIWMPSQEIFRRMPKRKVATYEWMAVSRALKRVFNFVSDVSVNSVDGVYAATIKKTVVLNPGKKGCVTFYLFSNEPLSHKDIPLDVGIFQKAWDEYARTEMGKNTKALKRKKHKTGTNTEQGDGRTTNTGNKVSTTANDARRMTLPPQARPSWQYMPTNGNMSNQPPFASPPPSWQYVSTNGSLPMPQQPFANYPPSWQYMPTNGSRSMTQPPYSSPPPPFQYMPRTRYGIMPISPPPYCSPPPPPPKKSSPPETREAKLKAMQRLYKQEYGTDFMEGEKDLETFFQNLLQETGSTYTVVAKSQVAAAQNG